MSEWIKCSDRLPENGIPCLVFAPEYDVDGYSIATYTNGRKKWTDNHFTFITEYVTHWMPLPEPPKK